ncbi:hypothetical protein MSG28_007542 [Choristoneura fumiferana]|uniref:Uncharacterized protein n=1 Tax=Choristoneura fumiferana TaxID=7141 RepID=A0ACC0JXQ4_CHOFU|nr:hypothetical protein MSG28_007542 [Choristoneura fumiferana]
MLALSLAAPMAMSWEVIMEEEQDPVTKMFFKKPFCAPSEFGSHSLAIYRLLLYICQYIIPLCVITFAYAHLALKLWGARAPGNALEIRDANHMKNKKKDGQSYRTRILSFRSTNERSVYATRKSLNLAPVDMSRNSRSSCHCLQNQDTQRENGFRSMKAIDLDTHNFNKTFNNSGTKRRLEAQISRNNDMPIGDERVSELYIFPNSNIVEFTDISYDDKV